MTRTATWHRVRGDTNDTLRLRIDGVEDLAGLTTVTARVWRTTAPVGSTTLTAEVTDPDERTVTVSLAPWLTTAAPGVWNLELDTTWVSGEDPTFPSGQPARIVVRAAAPNP